MCYSTLVDTSKLFFIQLLFSNLKYTMKSFIYLYETLNYLYTYEIMIQNFEGCKQKFNY